MNTDAFSNVSFTSNLQPIGETERFNDSALLQYVYDPFALDFMHRQKFNMTESQQQAWEKASGHCSLAFADDYPWGTVKDKSGKEKVVCKCLNIRCSQFRKCRPFFDPMELSVLIDNELAVLLRQHKAVVPQFVPVDADLITIPPVSFVDETEPELSVETESQNQLISEQEKADPVCPADQSIDNTEAENSSVRPTGFDSFVFVSHETVLSAPVSARMIINAGPGSGKTWTLIEKLIAFSSDPEVDPENILVLCYSRAAVAEINKRLKEAEQTGRISAVWHRFDFSTLDSFAFNVLLYAQERYPELIPPGRSLLMQDYDDNIRLALSVLQQKPDILSMNSHVLIDEVQDLVGCRAEFVLRMLSILSPQCGFTVLGDACQSLYDYNSSNDQEIMPSAEFYKILFERFPQAVRYSFASNHRLSDELRTLLTPYREAILSGNPDACRNVLSALGSGLSDSGLLMASPDDLLLNKLIQQGTVAVLTRSNVDALRFSSRLKAAGIAHVLSRSGSGESVSSWVAQLFTDFPSVTMNRELFEYAFENGQLATDASSEECWDALVDHVQANSDWYRIEDVLKSLLRRGKHPALFRQQGSENVKLTVSTIHKAKGREYDTVIIPDTYSTWPANENKPDDINEHKVCYVAFTRPRSRLMTAKSASVRNCYVSKEQKTGRCFGVSYTHSHKKWMSAFEVGYTGDINILSFAEDPERQHYICDTLQVDDALVLIKDKDFTPFVRYRIVPQEQPDLILGYTSSDFMREISRARSIMLGFPAGYDPQYFPEVWDDVYVAEKVSCIVSEPPGELNVRRFGSMGIWYGFTVTGFAKVDNDSY